MSEANRGRLYLLWIPLALILMLVVGRLFVIQVVQAQEYRLEHEQIYGQQETLEPIRGPILDRNGAVLATTGYEYRLAVTPIQVNDPDGLAGLLSTFLVERRSVIRAELTPPRDENGELPRYWVVAPRVSAEAARGIAQALEDAKEELGSTGLFFEPLPHRIYPQGTLLSHVLGALRWVNEEQDIRGITGLEGFYNAELEGEPISVWENPLLHGSWDASSLPQGGTLVLTVDRTVQYVTEKVLEKALQDYAAESGSIIVMDPRDNSILAMASRPAFDPNDITEDVYGWLEDPCVSEVFEPGSIHKVLTMAAAIDSGTVRPDTTYEDRGVIEVGGHPITNWDGGAHGTTDMVTLLAKSLNVGSATIATWMGRYTFYEYVSAFGLGYFTGVDLAAEVVGQVRRPDTDSEWSEADLGTNSFGQGIAVTPLQELVAIAALANDGRLMQPHLVAEIRHGDQVRTYQPRVLGQPIRPQTARTVASMMEQAVVREVPSAMVPGYAVAGKTGTAQVADGVIYHPTDVIAAFVGFLPADDPQVIVLVKIDRPQVPMHLRWGSVLAAPVFSELAQQLVVLLDIPPDSERHSGRLAGVGQ